MKTSTRLLACLAALVGLSTGAPVVTRISSQELAASRETPFRDQLDPATWERAKRLTGDHAFIDVHAHDPFKPVSPRYRQQVTLPLMREAALGGLVAVVPFSQLPSEHPLEAVLSDLRAVKSRLETDGGIGLALGAADLARARETKRPVVMLAVEYFQGPLEGRVDALEIYHREGVRVFGLSHGGKDTVAEGKGDAAVLSGFGRQAVSVLNRLGMAVDVTHLPPRVRRQVVEVSRAPVIVSHTGALGVVRSEFNLDDKTLDLVVARDGLIGLTFYSEQLSKATNAAAAEGRDPAKWPPARVEDVVDQIDYLRRRVGLDHVALGSDYGGSGRMAPAGLETIEGLPLVAYHMLTRGYAEAQIRQVLGGNFVRFLERVERASTRLEPSGAR